MRDVGPHWRNFSYEVMLGTVLATAAETSRYQGHAVQEPSSTSSDSFKLSYNDDASTPSANAAMPLVKFHTSTASSPDSAPTLSDDVLYCPDPSCKAPFFGSYRKKHLTRHLKTALRHKQDAHVKCWVCRVTFGRIDNLQRHVRDLHHLDSALISQNISSILQDRGARG